jgi:ABC-type uncharacterized transport system permease subunit
VASLDPQVEKSFSFAQEAVKQMITLSTAIFTLTLTFRKDVAPVGTDITFLEIGWGLYLASILFGMCTLYNLAGNVKVADPTIDADGVRLFGILQAGAFLAGLVLTLLFGFDALN